MWPVCRMNQIIFAFGTQLESRKTGRDIPVETEINTVQIRLRTTGKQYFSCRTVLNENT